MLVSVSRMKGSSHSRMGFATRLPPNALPKSSLKRISGGFLRPKTAPVLNHRRCMQINSLNTSNNGVIEPPDSLTRSSKRQHEMICVPVCCEYRCSGMVELMSGTRACPSLQRGKCLCLVCFIFGAGYVSVSDKVNANHIQAPPATSCTARLSRHDMSILWTRGTPIRHHIPCSNARLTLLRVALVGRQATCNLDTHLRAITAAPNPGMTGTSGLRMTRATPATCRSVTLGTSRVCSPPAGRSMAIAMFASPAHLNATCHEQPHLMSQCLNPL